MTDLNSPGLENEEALPRKGGLSLSSMVLLTGIAMVVIVFGLQLARQQQTQPESGPAPDFTLTTFDGEEIRLSDLRGQIIFLNFWASWCGPCLDEAPDLQRVYERYQDRGVEFIGIAYTDTDWKSLDFIEQFSLTYPNGPDRGNIISDDYNIQGVPESFVINREGQVVHTIFLPTNEDQLSAILDELLASET
jgi:cytochrome c biogenesis protein CcmG/thiol:disulfide interchange protein DsbE